MPGRFSWHARPGLAGGVDKDGSRVEALLAMGFGSVEIGSVMPEAVPAVAARLLPLHRSGLSGLGVGIGLPPELPVDHLSVVWLAGLNGLWPAVDYLSFNLSAKANQRFMQAEHGAQLARACQAVTFQRDRLWSESGRHLPVALKLPLGDCADALPMAAFVAAAGFDQLTVVLPEAGDRFARLAELARQLDKGPALVAVGGIRSAADVRAARQAGAAGVQVHRLFVEQGAACLAALDPAWSAFTRRSSDKPASD